MTWTLNGEPWLSRLLTERSMGIRAMTGVLFCRNIIFFHIGGDRQGPGDSFLPASALFYLQCMGVASQ